MKISHGGKLIPQNSAKTTRNMMSAILQTTGPVSTQVTIRQNWKFLCNVSATEFLEAATALKELGLGHVNHSLPTKEFVKKRPEEACQALNMSPDLCSAEMYALRYSHSPLSKKKFSHRGNKLVPQNSAKTTRNMMSAILQTTGPVSTQVSIRQNWKFLFNASAAEFLEAALSLEALGLGRVHSLPTKVFVKTRPEEACHALSMSPDLCFAELYKLRYSRSPSRCLGMVLRGSLIAKKLVSEKQMM